MTVSEQGSAAPLTMTEAEANYRRRLTLGFTLFIIFFTIYMGTAIIQTAGFKDLAAMPFMGIPFGMFLSLAIFPISWIIITIYFILWR